MLTFLHCYTDELWKGYEINGLIGKLLLLPTLTKTICTTISALIPYPSLMVESMTIPKRSNESSVAYLTASVLNTACRLSRIRTKHPQDKYGSTRKAVNLPVITCTVKICVKPLITVEVLNISKNIYREKDILPTSRVSIGKYDYRSTNTLQGWTRLMNGGLPKT